MEGISNQDLLKKITSDIVDAFFLNADKCDEGKLNMNIHCPPCFISEGEHFISLNVDGHKANGIVYVKSISVEFTKE